MTSMRLVILALAMVAGGLAQAAPENDVRRVLKVKLALLDHLGTEGMRVEVESNSGDVILSGAVGESDTMRRAVTVAKSVSGVEGVRNRLRIEPASDAGAAKGAAAEAALQDAILASTVRLMLIESMGADGSKIGARAANGDVTLEFVPELSQARRQEAIAAAKGVVGVAKVSSAGSR